MYFVTFSRKTGTNGTQVAQRVADQLGYRLYDTEAIENAAREMGFLEDVREIDEKVPSLFHRFFSQKPEIYLDRLNSVIYELASKGNAVFLGRGSHILLRNFESALHVRVTASLEYRIRNMMKRGLSRDGAMKAIHKSDHERGAFIKLFFGVDWENPELYDLVINMDHLSVDLAIETILHVARSDEMRARSMDAMKSLEMMGLARRVEAALTEAGFIDGPSVSILEPGRVELTGIVSLPRDKARVEEIVKGVKGVQSIDNQIKVIDRPKYA